MNIETKREEVANQTAIPVSGKEPAKVNLVQFTIKTAYTPSKASSMNQAVPTSATSNAPATSGAPAQVAKN
jgi:hypothetical protein